MEFDLGLWRSTLGETHPHQGFAVDMDFWPQSAHVTALRHDGTAAHRLMGGLVGCFSGGGGGSQLAMFRRDLVPLLEAAKERWRSRGTKLPQRTTLEGFLTEVQRGFDALTTPNEHEHLQASTVSVLFEGPSAAIASTGLERAFRLRGGNIELVSPRLSVFDTLNPATRPSVTDDMARLLAALPAGLLGKSVPARASGRSCPWQTRDIDLEPDDMLLLVSGVSDQVLTHRIVEDAVARAASVASAPEKARAIGEYFAEPSAWSSPPDAAQAADVRWRVVSRGSIAVLRAREGHEGRT